MPTLLTQILPKAGFTFPLGSNVTSRPKHDKAIQRALRDAGTRWSRPDVTDTLIAAFETATVTFQAVYVPLPDISHMMAVHGALDVAQRSMAWAARLDSHVFYQLMLGTRAARRISLKTRGVDEAEPGSWGAKLGAAVDGFDEALYRRGWSGSAELRALEGECGDADEDIIRRARSTVVAAARVGEELSDGLQRTRPGSGWGGEVEMEDDVEIITEKEEIESEDAEMADCGHDMKGIQPWRTEEPSIEPYLGRDGGY